MKVEIEIPEGHELKKEGDTYRVVKVENRLPESWEELGLDLPDGCEYWHSEYIALDKLRDLLKAYNDDWTPDWIDLHQKKYVIEMSHGEWIGYIRYTDNKIFAFETKAKRDHFLRHHIGLLNQAKPLFGG